jgi:hypothetical protein
MRVLLVGWFSFENSDSTAGDFLVCDVVRQWLTQAGHSCDVALAPPFEGGVDLNRVDSHQYSHVVFVCGPFMQNAFEAQFLGRFADCVVVGVNLTLPIPLDVWNPFDFLVERDSSRAAHPDLAFVSHESRVPVTGVCLVEPYDGAIVGVANTAVERLIATREMAVVPIDTRLDVNATGLRTKAEVESILARMDVVITTRLHGTILALKNGVPALAIDPEPGGAKIKRQAETIGWPVVFTADALDERSLQLAFDYCLSDAARAKARECSARAVVMLEEIGRTFVPSIEALHEWQSKRLERTAFALQKGWEPPTIPSR